MRKHFHQETYIQFHDFIIPSPTPTTQIHHIYLSLFPMFLIQTKNYTPSIFPTHNQSKSTQLVYKHKHYFQNPFPQNYPHIKPLS
ncbi:nuclease-related domain-containing protein, partial [Neisseria sicca]|uniref:nuclease-related domain-containing protein n=1 Tax=Neisseria sicca TaxID=490 RepID=UPI0028FC0F8E